MSTLVPARPCCLSAGGGGGGSRKPWRAPDGRSGHRVGARPAPPSGADPMPPGNGSGPGEDFPSAALERSPGRPIFGASPVSPGFIVRWFGTRHWRLLESAPSSTCFLKPINHLRRSEEHTSELQSLMRISYAVFCLKKQTNKY